jgi:hypothetical protein
MVAERGALGGVYELAYLVTCVRFCSLEKMPELGGRR